MQSKYSLFFSCATLILFVFASCTKDPTCSDGIQNGGEMGIDCCGSCDSLCFNILDCMPGISDPNCNDGILNQNETEIDCGGICPACEPTDTTDVVTDAVFFSISNGTETFNFGEENITATYIDFTNQLTVSCSGGVLDIFNSFTLNIGKDDLQIGTIDLADAQNTSLSFLNASASPCSSASGVLTITEGSFEEKMIKGATNFSCSYLSGSDDVFTEGAFYFIWE